MNLHLVMLTESEIIPIIFAPNEGGVRYVWFMTILEERKKQALNYEFYKIFENLRLILVSTDAELENWGSPVGQI